MWLWILIGTPVAGLFVTYLYHKRKRGVCNSTRRLNGKTAIVTGANTGIGFETALDLARRNARVILACRNMEQGQKAVAAIQEQTGNRSVLLRHLDLSSLTSVRKFVTDFLKEENRLDILVNNAGIAACDPPQQTEDGLDRLMATNYFGPFLLTNLLLDLLKSTPSSRVVNVSSIAHYAMFGGKIDLENLNCQKYFPKNEHYTISKLANIIFSNELARKLEGSGVSSNSLHPGAVHTEVSRTIPQPWRTTFNMVSTVAFRDAKAGAQTSIYLAVSGEVEGVTGKYFSECKIQAEGSPDATDAGLAKKMWEATEKLTGLVD